MNPLFLNPWLIGGAVIVVFFAAGAGYLKGYTGQAKETAKCEAQVEQITEVQRVLQQKADEYRLLSNSITENSQKQFAAAADYWNKHPRVIRLRESAANSTCAKLPTLPTASAGIDARPAERGPDSLDLTIEQINTLINNAEQDAAQVKALVAWIKQQHEASKR